MTNYRSKKLPHYFKLVIEKDEQASFSLLTDDLGPSDYDSVDPCLFQSWPTLPLTEADTNWGDCPDDAFDISKDWEDYCPT
jgi:hypothetical protein